MLTVNPAPTTGASCQEGLADSGTAAARVLQSPVSSIQSPVLDLPLSCVSAFAVLYLHRLNTPCLNTLLDVGAMASAAFCSTAALQPAVLYARALPKATKSSTPLLLRPLSRATFPAILGHPPRSPWGNQPWSFCKERPNGATPPPPPPTP